MAQEAKRNPVSKRFDLIQPEGLDLWASRAGIGVPKYSAENYMLGLPGDKNPVNHAFKHLVKYLQTKDPDQLGAVLWNLGAEAYFRAHPDLYDDENRLYPWLEGELDANGRFSYRDNSTVEPEPPETQSEVSRASSDNPIVGALKTLFTRT